MLTTRRRHLTCDFIIITKVTSFYFSLYVVLHFSVHQLLAKVRMLNYMMIVLKGTKLLKMSSFLFTLYAI